MRGETGWQQCADLNSPACLIAVAGRRSTWAWCVPCVSSLFPAMPVLSQPCRVEKQGNARPHLQELWSWQNPFSTRKRGATCRCHACCHSACILQWAGVAMLPQAALALAEPELVAAYSFLLGSLLSNLSRQFLQRAGVCTLAPGAGPCSVLPGSLFYPPSTGGPMGICTSMDCSRMYAVGSRP